MDETCWKVISLTDSNGFYSLFHVGVALHIFTKQTHKWIYSVTFVFKTSLKDLKTARFSVPWQLRSLPTPRKFQEQECPPSPEPKSKEKDKSGCHCVIVWVGLITVTHSATLDHPTHSAWHHILSGWLTAAFSTCMTSDSLSWDALTRNRCPQDITMDNWQCQILTPLYLQP